MATAPARFDAAGRRRDTIALSLRFGLSDALLAQGPQAVIDQLAEFKRLGLTHVVLEFRRDDLKQMIEILDLVTGEIRPAVDRV